MMRIKKKKKKKRKKKRPIKGNKWTLRGLDNGIMRQTLK